MGKIKGIIPLFKRRGKPLDPLEKVPETPPPGQPYYYPFNSEEEYLEALKSDSERRATEIENEQMRKGKIPFFWNLRKSLLTIGLSAVALGLFAWLKGCG